MSHTAPTKYTTSTRYGNRPFSSKAKAIKLAKAEVADGWPSHVR